MKTIRTEGIVLRRTNYGEADRIIQFLTPLGRRSVMARAVRKEKSKLAGGVELFAVSDIVIGEGKGSLAILVSARLRDFYRHILENYDAMQFAYEAIKQVSNASETIDEPEWYDVLSQVLAGLDDNKIPLKMIETWFYLRYASLLGYELSLTHDTSGDLLLPEEYYRYDVSDKGLQLAVQGGVTSDHIKLLRLLAAKPLKLVMQIGGIEHILPECWHVARQHASI